MLLGDSFGKREIESYWGLVKVKMECKIFISFGILSNSFWEIVMDRGRTGYILENYHQVLGLIKKREINIQT